MDPALQELLESNGYENEEVEVLVKARNLDNVSADMRIVSRFGDIATARIPKEKILQVWENVDCLKAARFISKPRDFSVDTATGLKLAEDNIIQQDFEHLRPKGSGNKTIIAVLDWGFDFTHPFFRFSDGTTKFMNIWDQSSPFDGHNKYGYGRVINRSEINQALRSDEPFRALGYHPDKAGYFPTGTHGTHVAGIASRIAPHLDLIGIHLANGKMQATNSLGDSVRIVEGLDFVLNKIGKRPCSINMSVGSMGGSHTGKSLVEQVIDTMLQSRKGLAVCQSAGNYYRSKTHSQGAITQNNSKKLMWEVSESDRTPNELEIWYDSQDDFILRMKAPNREENFELRFTNADSPNSQHKKLADISVKSDIRLEEQGKVGRIYMRKKDSTTGLNHIDIFLYPNAPPGVWEVELEGNMIYSGEFHAWIERDGSCFRCQSNFNLENVSALHTTGTIANSKFGITVGAYDAHDSNQSIATFSSAGRVLDEKRRIKPELLAPGVNISSSRSANKNQLMADGNALTVKSGTSMAAPQVTGAIALFFDHLHEQLPITKTRKLLFQSLDPYLNYDEAPERYGHGVLNVQKLIAMTKDYEPPPHTSPESNGGSVKYRQALNGGVFTDNTKNVVNLAKIMETNKPQDIVFADTIPADELSWPGATSEQILFLRTVYNINLNRSLRKGKFNADLSPDDLTTIEGRFQARTNAALACRKMLVAARKAIARQNLNVQIGLTSAYRSSSHQFRLWNRYFRHNYYPQTKRARRRRKGGEHGALAALFLAKYIRRRIATPGFSNHNKGTAIDLLNKENGQYIRNKSLATHLRVWKKSWFWKWLLTNAERYGFYQNPQIDEPWHWEYHDSVSDEETIVSANEQPSENLFNDDIPLTPNSGGLSIGLESLQIGDIILSTTQEFISGAIRKLTNSPVSHSILYIGNGQVVEAVANGVILNTLENALNQAIHAVAFRHPDITLIKALQIRDFAGQQLGARYNYWGIVKQARFQLSKKSICNKTGNFRLKNKCISWIGKIYLGTTSNDEFFCSELVLAAYMKAGMPLTTTPPHWNSPADLANLYQFKRLMYVGHIKA